MVLDEHATANEVVATRAEAALLRRFPSHPVDDVRLAVRHALRAFDAARVRTFLPVLVERAAAERLAMVASAPGTGTPGEAALRLPSRAADVGAVDRWRTPAPAARGTVSSDA